jgi:uncharacterized protein with PQ loop repeat
MVFTNDAIGYIASSFYIISLFPELHAVYVNRECNLSMYFLIFQIVTTLLFIIYDILIEIIPLLVADVTLLIELLILIWFKLTCKGKNKLAIKASIV